MPVRAMLPADSGLRVDAVTGDQMSVVVVVVATREAVPCPICGHLARRVHSRFRRTIADLPWQGVAVRLDLHSRRFWCDDATCPRRIFAERFPGLVAAGARRSDRLRTLYLALSLALGGEAGARLAGALGLLISPDTLLRLATALPPTSFPTPRVLGVDDWSWRKGRRWGTVLVDLERHCTIDLLPDRKAATLATWLRARPGIQFVTRDRAGAYADGIRQGAPEAIQIADRFHLVKNAGETLERVLQRHHASLRAAAKAADQAKAASCAPADETASAAPPASTSEVTATAAVAETPSHARRVARYEEVLALSRQGLGPKAIGQRVGLTRQTVARWLRAGGFPERPRTPRGSPLLAPYEPYLRERWQAGCQNARQLWREVRELGFGGGAETVRRCVLAWRTEQASPGPPRRRTRPQPQPPPPPPATRPLSPRQARWLLVKPGAELDADEQAYLEQLVHECPDVLVAQRLTREFNRLVRERDEAALTPWLEAATGSELPEFRDFAAGIRRDLAAVEAALRYAWSNGQTEAQVLQLKTVRRQMRGRGGFELVRRRVVEGATSGPSRRQRRRRAGVAA